MLNSREWASVISTGAAFVGVLVVPSMRTVLVQGVRDVARAFSWKIGVIFVVLFAWITGCVWLGWRLSLWDWGLAKDTIVITATLAIPMTFRITNANSGGAIVRRILTDTLGITALLAFYLNVKTFPLWIELLAQPLIAILLVLNAVATAKKEWTPTRKLTGALLVLIGLSSIVLTTFAILGDWNSLVWPELLRAFLLTIWLPALLFPLFYVGAFLMTVENILTRVSLGHTAERPRRRVELALLLGLHVRVKLAARFNGRYNGIAKVTTYRAATRFMRDFRAEVRRDDTAECARVNRLRTNTGKTGVDVDGSQLDRREFDVTKERLEWISVTQMGRYEGNGNRYWDDRDDLTDIMVDAKKHGLPDRHGFTVESTPDRQRWRAWRKLPSGWVLGMGGSGWRSEWVYSGPKAPSSWPGDTDLLWVDKMTSPDLPPDWAKNDNPIVKASDGL